MAAKEITAAGAELRLSIGRMTEHDLLEVVAIEELCGLSPWGWDAYHRELQSQADTIMLVARLGALVQTIENPIEIAGFIVARLVAEELHVNTGAAGAEFRPHET